MNRRNVLKTGLTLAGGSLLASQTDAQQPIPEKSNDQTPEQTTQQADIRRKLGGTLEVSSVGLGVQTMGRTYQTTIPSRTKMHTR